MQELSTLKTATGQYVIRTEAGRGMNGYSGVCCLAMARLCGNMFDGKGSGFRLSSVTQLMMFLFSLSPGEGCQAHFMGSLLYGGGVDVDRFSASLRSKWVGETD